MAEMEKLRAVELEDPQSKELKHVGESVGGAIPRRSVGWSCAAALVFAGVFAALVRAQTAPEQPIPYSHKLHAGTLQLKCAQCHANADPGDAMGIPAATVCMACHSSIAAKKPSIQKLAAAAKSGEEIAWVRVYHTPPFVWFSHRSHLAAGSKCETCHGPVAARETMKKEGDISMNGCMNCHRSKNVSNACGFCHEQP